MLRANDFGPFRYAVEQRKVTILNQLWTWTTDIDDKKKMLRDAFREAARLGSFNILTQLWTWGTELGVSNEMLRARDYDAFREAITYNRMNVSAQLYVWAGSFNLQHALNALINEEQRRTLIRSVEALLNSS